MKSPKSIVEDALVEFVQGDWPIDSGQLVLDYLDKAGYRVVPKVNLVPVKEMGR